MYDMYPVKGDSKGEDKRVGSSKRADHQQQADHSFNDQYGDELFNAEAIPANSNNNPKMAPEGGYTGGGALATQAPMTNNFMSQPEDGYPLHDDDVSDLQACLGELETAESAFTQTTTAEQATNVNSVDMFGSETIPIK